MCYSTDFLVCINIVPRNKYGCGSVKFPWISQTPSVNFPWNSTHFKNPTVKSRIFSPWIRLVPNGVTAIRDSESECLPSSGKRLWWETAVCNSASTDRRLTALTMHNSYTFTTYPPSPLNFSATKTRVYDHIKSRLGALPRFSHLENLLEIVLETCQIQCVGVSQEKIWILQPKCPSSCATNGTSAMKEHGNTHCRGEKLDN